MGFWDKVSDEEINNAEGSKGGEYLLPGNYVVQIQRCKEFTTREKDEAFIAELLVIESDNEKMPPGKKPALFIKELPKYPELYLGNVADFIRAGLASMAEQHGEECPETEEIQLTKELGLSVTGTDNLLAGVYLTAYAFNKPTREGKDFTRINWSTPPNLAEILAAA
jgi:hypothetical protein